MCLALPISNNIRCFTVNGLQVLCLTDCRLLLPAGGLDNCYRWVFCTNKVSVVWDFWLSGAVNSTETVAAAWFLERERGVKGRGGGGSAHQHTCLYAVLQLKHMNSLICTLGGWTVVGRLTTWQNRQKQFLSLQSLQVILTSYC